MELRDAVEVIGAPKAETLPRLSVAVAAAVPHTGLAELITCPQSPFRFHGELPQATGSAVTMGEVAALRPSPAAARGVWQGRAVVAGVDTPVAAFSSARSEPAALLVLLRTDDTPVSQERLAPVLALWDLLTAHRMGVQADATPGKLATSRAAAAARSIALSEAGDAHAAVLSALLRTLRDRGLDDAHARDRGIELAVTALSELRSRAELDQMLVEERASDAFERLADSLRRIVRPHGQRLDLGIPGAEEGADRMLPGDVVTTVSAVVRAAVHAMLEDQGGPDGRRDGRIHVAWKIDAADLRATVRDDGPGVLSRRSLEARRVGERLAPLGGRLEVDAVPGWGTTVTVAVPLAPLDTPRRDPLTELGERELEVLAHLARGRRNRDIAAQLHISESTVKFHLAKIFDKLGVSSRGEAAALAHRWGAAQG